MAYLKKDDLVIIPSASGANIQARVVDMQFRRFRRSWKDKPELCRYPSSLVRTIRCV